MDIRVFSRAIAEGDLETVELGLSRDPDLVRREVPADLTVHNDGGVLPMHHAVHTGQAGVVSLLLEKGADPEARNSYGRTALHDSIEYGHAEATRCLRDHGAVMDICSAAILGLEDEVARWLSADPGLANDFSTCLSPLGWAAFGNQDEIAKMLLEAGAEMNDFELHCAASVGHVKVGEVLLEAGADPQELNPESGCAAIHIAAAMPYTTDSTRFVRMLLARGADPNQPNAAGKTALHIAEEKKDKQSDQPSPEKSHKNFEGLIALLKPLEGKPA